MKIFHFLNSICNGGDGNYSGTARIAEKAGLVDKAIEFHVKNEEGKFLPQLTLRHLTLSALEDISK